MPTYGYRCPECGHEFDKFQKISDLARAECPECGTVGERVISGGAGFVFKGSGFYETDYKRAGQTKDEPKAASDDTGKKKDASPKKKKDSGTAKPKGDGS
jgi:putative FmdB family regulatory protein